PAYAVHGGVSAPEFPARDGGALSKRAELGPDDIRIHAARSDMNAEAAVDAGHDVVAADEPGIPLDALRDELRMLDVVGLAFDDARYQHFAFRHLDRFEHGPLMGVARVRRLELDRMRLRLPHDINDVLKRHVAVVRTGIVAPAQMHPDLSSRNVHERAVECLAVAFHPLAKTGALEVLKLRVP